MRARISPHCSARCGRTAANCSSRRMRLAIVSPSTRSMIRNESSRATISGSGTPTRAAASNASASRVIGPRPRDRSGGRAVSTRRRSARRTTTSRGWRRRSAASPRVSLRRQVRARGDARTASVQSIRTRAVSRWKSQRIVAVVSADVAVRRNSQALNGKEAALDRPSVQNGWTSHRKPGGPSDDKKQRRF